MIYFVTARDLNMVKIGYSANPHLRLVKIRADCPVPVLLERVMPGSRAEEGALHTAFSEWRVRGEWFHIVPAIDRCMADMTIPAVQPRIQQHKANARPAVESTEQVLTEILGFCADHNMSPTRFGDLALNDRPFVGQLSEGRELRRKTTAKLREFMSAYRADAA